MIRAYAPLARPVHELLCNLRRATSIRWEFLGLTRCLLFIHALHSDGCANHRPRCAVSGPFFCDWRLCVPNPTRSQFARPVGADSGRSQASNLISSRSFSCLCHAVRSPPHSLWLGAPRADPVGELDQPPNPFFVAASKRTPGVPTFSFEFRKPVLLFPRNREIFRENRPDVCAGTGKSLRCIMDLADFSRTKITRRKTGRKQEETGRPVLSGQGACQQAGAGREKRWALRRSRPYLRSEAGCYCIEAGQASD